MVVNLMLVHGISDFLCLFWWWNLSKRALLLFFEPFIFWVVLFVYNFTLVLFLFLLFFRFKVSINKSFLNFNFF